MFTLGAGGAGASATRASGKPTARASIEHLSPSTRNRLILVACILGSFVAFLDSSAVNVALPAIQNDLHGGLALQQWVVDSYLLTLGSLILVGGSLSDLFGAHRIFLLGIIGFGVMSILCAAAPDGTTLIVARALQGVSGALLTPSGLAVITATFEGEERGAAIGTWTSYTGISFVIGPLVGGWLVTSASWRWIFLINIPFAIATAILVAIVVPPIERDGPRPRVDVIGAILCTIGLAGPVYALIEEPKRGWGDPLILLTLLGGLAVFAAFLAWEQWATRHPMLPLRLFRRHNFSLANLETLTVYAGLSTQTFFLTLFLQQIAGYSPLKSGLALVPVTLIMFFLSPEIGRLTIRLGPRLFMGLGPIVAGLPLLWWTHLGRHVSYWVDLVPVLILFGIGLSMTVAPLTATVLADASERDAGIASGVNNAVARVAGLLGIALVGAAIAGPGNRLDLSGFHESMAITAALIVVGGITGLVGIRNPRPQ